MQHSIAAPLPRSVVRIHGHWRAIPIGLHRENFMKRHSYSMLILLSGLRAWAAGHAAA
jgi:hypothetical protein